MTIAIPEAVEAVGSAASSAESGAASASRGAAASRASSNRAASARRKVVLGQRSPERPVRATQRQSPVVTSGTAGSTGPSTQQRKKRRRTGTRSMTRTGKRGFKVLSGREHGGVLIAEFIAAVLIMVIGTLTRGPGKGYQVVMSELVIRLTALSMVFFVLFLLAPTKAGKAAMYFGLLVDLGVLLTATQQGVISDLASVVQGQPLKDATGNPVDTTALTADETEPEPAVSLPDAGSS